ncbi:AcrID1 family anti-CRISPR protein, partial [Aquimarina litoralis]
MNLKKVKRIIDMFFKEKNLDELTLAFKRSLILTENE